MEYEKSIGPRLISRIGVYLILLNRKGELALLRRSGTGFEDGLLSLISGNVQYGEGIGHAIIREAREECGADIEPGKLSLVHVMHRFKKKDDERIDFFFYCENWDGSLENLEPNKHSDASFYNALDLPSDIIPYHLQGLNLSCRNRFRKASWSEYHNQS